MPHGAGAGETCRPGDNGLALLRFCLLQQKVAARFEAELKEEFSLRKRSIGFQSRCARAARKIGEVDMGGQVRLARSLERIGKAMTANGLQRIAEIRLLVTVVNE